MFKKSINTITIGVISLVVLIGIATFKRAKAKGPRKFLLNFSNGPKEKSLWS